MNGVLDQLTRDRFPAHPSTVGAARRLVRRVVTEAGLDRGLDRLLDDAELVVSELVTNAVVHAGTDVEVGAVLREGILRIEVADGSLHLPAPRLYTELTGTGRGLRLVEQIVLRWGVRVEHAVKVVWCDLAATGRPAGDQAPLATTPAAPGTPEPGGFRVELRNLPLLLHAAWQMQAASLLREYLLVRLGDEVAHEEVEAHAAASDALALLEEHLPRPDLGDEPHAVMAASTEPLVSAEVLHVAIPADSVPHFSILDHLLDSALLLADRGDLLTPPTQPEIRAFRRWLCRQVAEQTRGGPATPWSVDSPGIEPMPRPAVAWDTGWVETSPRPLVAADDTNVVLAASPAALELLGYRNPEELVGRRLLDLVPARYRQAHLAGFTLHLFSGRRALIGTPVVVPALRSDGTEVDVELLLEAHPLPAGRRAFTAELRRSGPGGAAR
jgi:PAS domain S-box-containing protein